MFQQLMTPVAGSLGLSFIVASLPILAVLVGLGVLRRPAWEASLGGLVVAFVIAVVVWGLPVGLAVRAAINGAVFALWPVMWIVVNAMLLYNIAVTSGRFDAFRRWTLEHLPNDRRIVLVAIGFCFGALLEGIAGFGTPVAITSSLLILVGFPPLEALVFVLIFNTAPVAFGALGVPITVLGAVTNLPAATLGAMVGRQLPFIAVLLPFYVMFIYGGMRSLRAIWPVLLVAGGRAGADVVRQGAERAEVSASFAVLPAAAIPPPQAGFVPTAQWKGWAKKKVPSPCACATALCHASVSAGFNAARICCW